MAHGGRDEEVDGTLPDPRPSHDPFPDVCRRLDSGVPPYDTSDPDVASLPSRTRRGSCPSGATEFPVLLSALSAPTSTTPSRHPRTGLPPPPWGTGSGTRSSQCSLPD